MKCPVLLSGLFAAFAPLSHADSPAPVFPGKAGAYAGNYVSHRFAIDGVAVHRRRAAGTADDRRGTPVDVAREISRRLRRRGPRRARRRKRRGRPETHAALGGPVTAIVRKGGDRHPHGPESVKPDGVKPVVAFLEKALADTLAAK